MVQVAHGTRPLSLGAGPPLLNSRETPWAGMTFEVHRMGSAEDIGHSGPVDGECGALVIVDGHIEIVRRQGRRDVSMHASAGSVSFLSGSARPDLRRMRGSAEAVALAPSNAWFGRLLLDGPPREFGSLPMRATDPTMLALTCAMRQEVERGAPTGRLYAESLSIALLSYAVEQVPPSRIAVRGDLSDAQRRQLRNYVLENLGEDISLATLAALVGRSERHFSTLFKRAFGTTAHRYLVQARLAEGARLLERGGMEIAEVALRLGFCSQSHFSEAFRRAYGVTPSRYAAGRRVISTD